MDITPEEVEALDKLLLEAECIVPGDYGPVELRSVRLHDAMSDLETIELTLQHFETRPITAEQKQHLEESSKTQALRVAARAIQLYRSS